MRPDGPAQRAHHHDPSRPRRISLTVPRHLMARLDALILLEGALPNRWYGGSSTRHWPRAERDPVVQAALPGRRRWRLYLVGARPIELSP